MLWIANKITVLLQHCSIVIYIKKILFIADLHNFSRLLVFKPNTEVFSMIYTKLNQHMDLIYLASLCRIC